MVWCGALWNKFERCYAISSQLKEIKYLFLKVDFYILHCIDLMIMINIFVRSAIF